MNSQLELSSNMALTRARCGKPRLADRDSRKAKQVQFAIQGSACPTLGSGVARLPLIEEEGEQSGSVIPVNRSPEIDIRELKA